MSRKTKPGRTDKRRLKQEARDRQRDLDVIQDTAGRFTCPSEVVHDFLYQCTDRMEGVEIDLDFNRVAHQIWRDRPGVGQQIGEALAGFIEERERHLRALADLRQRFAAIEAQGPGHDHLEPIESYRELVRARIFPDVRPPV